MTKAELEERVAELETALAAANEKLSSVHTEEEVLYAVLAQDNQKGKKHWSDHDDIDKAIAMVNDMIEAQKNSALIPGALYALQMYTINEKGLDILPQCKQSISFVKGVTNDQNKYKQDGILVQELVAMLAGHFEKLNAEVPSEYGALVIVKLKEIGQLLALRQLDRMKAGTLGTDKK